MRQNLLYYLDLNFTRYIDITHLSNLLNVKVEALRTMTFDSLYLKFGDNFSDNRAISRQVETKKRRFCISCINKKPGVYKLLWQVKEIEICDVHLTMLQSQCENCKKLQPYISCTLGQMNCFNCEAPFYRQAEEEITNSDFIANQLKKYQDWEYLMTPELPLVNDIDGFGVKQSLVINFLYLCKRYKEKFGRINKDDIFRYENERIHSLRAHKEDTLNTFSLHRLFILTRKLGISIKEFSKLEIPNQFISTIFVDDKPKEMGPCLAPWCSSYGKNESIKKQNRHKDGMRGTYSDKAVCTSCYMKYGINQKNGVWEERQNRIDLFLKAIPYIEDGLSKQGIYRELKIKNEKVNEIIGYLTYHKVLSKQQCKGYTPKEEPEDVINVFRELSHETRVIAKMLKKGRKLFGWTPSDFFYFYATREVQNHFIFEEYKEKNIEDKKATVNKWKIKVIKAIKTSFEIDKDITARGISELIGASPELLYLYDLHYLVKEARQKQYKLRIEKQKQQIWNQVLQYLQFERSKDDPVILKKNIYNYISLSPATLKRHYPEIDVWIDRQIQKELQKNQELELESYKQIAREVIEDSYKKGNKPSIEDIVRVIGASETNLRKRYKELISFIKEYRYRMKKKNMW